MTNQPKRSPLNRNHTLHYAPSYRVSEHLNIDFPVMTGHGPLIVQYLERTRAVFSKALKEHSKVLALRFDLYLPEAMLLPPDADDNVVIDRFLNSLASQLDWERIRSQSPHHRRVRHIVAREYAPTTGRVHFHVMLLINGHAYQTLGTKDYPSSLYAHIIQAWASALRVPWEVADPCVHVTTGAGEQCQYYLLRNALSEGLETNLEVHKAAFFRASYLCKLKTKQYGGRDRGLMTSRH